MTKHTNPFYTLDEALHVLKNVGAKPMSNPFRYDESEIHWPDHILSVRANRVYNDTYEHYFEMEIHVDREGFDAFVKMTGLTVSRDPDCEDELVVRPGSLLKVFALETKGDAAI